MSQKFFNNLGIVNFSKIAQMAQKVSAVWILHEMLAKSKMQNSVT